MKFLPLLPLLLVVAVYSAFSAPEATTSLRRPSPTLASLPPPAATGPLRILLVDDDISDNNHYPDDKRLSPSDRVFRKLVADAVGGDAKAWAVESVKPYSSGPGIDRLRGFPLVIWYTGASYGGNPDNAAVLSIEDEKTVRRYLEEVGGVVLLVSPGYLSKVLGGEDTWEKSKWPFLSEVLGIRGGQGLAQRFLPGTATASDGAQFNVGPGNATVESQFSLVNPAGAAVLFTTIPSTAKGAGPGTPIATSHSYGRGRILYVGFTFENLAEPDLAPAFRHLLAATGLQSTVSPAVANAPAASNTPVVSSPEAEPATVQVTGTPATAVVSWTLQTATLQNASLGVPEHTAKSAQPKPAPQTPTVKVERLVPNAAPLRLTVASPDTLRATDPGPLTPGRAVTYRVTLTDARGLTGIKEASFTPQAKDPDRLSATAQADRTIVLTWPEVPGVASYQVSGTMLTAPVTVRNATEWRSLPQSPGSQQWTVASLYEPGGVLTAASTWPSVRSRVVPTAGRPFLSMPNGTGSIGESTALYDKQCEASRTGEEVHGNCPDAGWFLSLSAGWLQNYGSKYDNSQVEIPWPSAAFADLNDLGLGRRVNCTVLIDMPRFTMCWATSHGNLPASGQPRNGTALAALGEQVTDVKSLNIIINSAQGAFFGTWELNRPIVTRAETPSEREDAFVDASGKRYLTALDSQGPKSVPNACLSCHGGRYDATRKIVVGASLMPLIPAHLTFSSPQARANSEEQIRRINQIILESTPSPTVRAQITTLYNGTPGTPGARANDAAVPSGWASQPGLYRQVIAPYCGTCHFSQTGMLHFGTYANLQLNKQRVQKAVCVDFSMPHSEQGFRRFWTEGGAVSLPGLLSTALGYPKCSQ